MSETTRAIASSSLPLRAPVLVADDFLPLELAAAMRQDIDTHFADPGGGVPRGHPRSVELLVCSRALHLFANHPGKDNSARSRRWVYQDPSGLVDRHSRHGQCDLALS